MIDQLIQQLTAALNNQFLSGGIVLMVLGAAAAFCRRLPGQFMGWLRRRLIITVDVANDDPAFFWLATWLAAQPYSKRARSLTVSTRRDHYGNITSACDPAPAGRESNLPDIVLTPAPGNHIFLYKGRLVWLTRDRKESGGGDGKNGGGFASLWNRESFQVRILGRSQSVARSLVEDARRMAITEKKTRTDIHVAAYDYWKQVDSRDPRPLSTVYLPAGVAESVLADVRGFMDGRDWYVRCGVPYRRGYLLHGLPGTGKTSLITALAGELRLNLYILNLSSGSLSDDKISHLLAQVPPASVILLEDIDCAFAARAKGEDVNNQLTFSGLLNALDGAASREGWLVFMTTNHKDALDPALVRPGRADVHVEFGHATAEQAARMYRAFFPETPDAGARQFGEMVELRLRWTMAEVQQHLMLHRDAPGDALSTLLMLAAKKAAA